MDKQLTQIDSKERVAFDLMMKIRNDATDHQDDKKFTKKISESEWLKLYQKCLFAVKFHLKPEGIQ